MGGRYDAATNTAKQIGFLYPGTTDAQRISRVGITPMIGLNDTQPETFTLANAQQVTAWAKANNVPMLAWWALVRDQPCANNALVSNCGGTSTRLGPTRDFQ
jgi:chitinase